MSDLPIPVFSDDPEIRKQEQAEWNIYLQKRNRRRVASEPAPKIMRHTDNRLDRVNVTLYEGDKRSPKPRYLSDDKPDASGCSIVSLLVVLLQLILGVRRCR